MQGKKSKTISYSFGKVEIYPNYLVMVINEGETVKPKYNDKLVELSKSEFKNRPFGYITHRKNSYGVDPKIYIETSRIENLMAFAVVTNEQLNISNTEIEKLFLKKPFQVFDDIENAVDWVESEVTGKG